MIYYIYAWKVYSNKTAFVISTLRGSFWARTKLNILRDLVYPILVFPSSHIISCFTFFVVFLLINCKAKGGLAILHSSNC